jgi:hypothetical protein
MGDFLHGNVNLFILFLVVVALLLFSRGKDMSAGLTMALAIACKVTPLLFVPYFLWKRAWKTLLGTSAGLVLFLWLVPAAFLGSHHNRELFESWWAHMVRPFVVGGQVTTEHINQSLPGVVFRLASASPSFLDEKGLPLRYDNLVSLDPIVLRWLVKGCMAAFALLVVLVCRTPLAQRRGWRLPAEFGIVLVGMLLFSERTWKHHCVTLLVPFAVLSYYLVEYPGDRRLRAIIVASLTATMILMCSTSTGLFPADAAKMAQVFGVYVIAYLLLLANLVLILRRRDDDCEAELLAN